MPGRTRRLTRQVLRFFIISVAWAAGLGLVTGSIVLIATPAAPRPGDQNSLPREAPSAAVSKTAGSGYQVVASFSGHGNRTTAHFRVNAELRWQLSWVYRCDPQAEAKQFTLLRADTEPQPTIRRTTEDFAARGRGSAWFGASGHRHYLRVISACSWRVKVVQAA